MVNQGSQQDTTLAQRPREGREEFGEKSTAGTGATSANGKGRMTPAVWVASSGQGGWH